MSKQTPLTKAIEHVENKIVESNEKMKSGIPDTAKTILRYEIATLNKVVLHLYSLLPYEREVIEGAFEDGSTNLDFGTPNYTYKTDYFTKTFINGND